MHVPFDTIINTFVRRCVITWSNNFAYVNGQAETERMLRWEERLTAEATRLQRTGETHKVRRMRLTCPAHLMVLLL